MLFSIYVLAFIAIIGLIIGSFLNVVILRTISEESIVFPASHCPKCNTPLKWYHNIPLLSYLFLKGKCAYCKEHISFQYPLVEFITGCVFVGLFLLLCNPFDALFGLNAMNNISAQQIITYIFSVSASCLLIVIAGTDILSMQVATLHTYILAGLGLLYGIIMTVMNYDGILHSPGLCSLLCGIIGFAIMEIYRFIASKIAAKCAHGEGDAYIAGAIGAYTGALCGNIRNIFFIIISAIIIAAIIAFPSFFKNLIKSKNKLSLISFAALIVYSVILHFSVKIVTLNIWTEIIALIIFGILAIWFSIEIIKGIRNKTSDGIPCPFGPSLVIATFIAVVLFGLAT